MVEKAPWTTAEGQLRMQRSADERLRTRYRTFNEIMTGPNPLTREEMKKLLARRPDDYGFLEAWV